MKEKMRIVFTYLTGMIFMFMGVLHFTHTEYFMQIMPAWIPLHLFCVLASGVAEMAGAPV